MPAYESTEDYLNSTQLGRQIIRIRENVSAALTAIGNKGVTVPTGSNSDDLADLIGAIQTGGSTPSTTSHTIYFEFSDETSTTITAYYDSSFISDAIRATTPATYDSKTVTLAQLDGVTWYEVSGDIPLNTELVDYNAVRAEYCVYDDGTIVEGESWECVTDYIPIDPTMTFTFVCSAWYGIGFYDSNKTHISGYSANDIGTLNDEVVRGTITPSLIPSNAAYIVLTGNPYSLTSNRLSLIRTA